MRRLNAFIPVMLVFATTIAVGTERMSGERTFTADGVSLFNAEKRRNGFGAWEYTVRDLSYNPVTERALTDLTLSFNKPSPARDDTARYEVRRASYTHMPGQGSLGGGAAYFARRDSRVDIPAAPGLWLGAGEDKGSFTIDFRFRPATLDEGAVLFSRIGALSGLENGIEIRITNRRVRAALKNMFRDSNGITRSITLGKGPELRVGKWYHYTLSFDRITGKVSHLIDENEYDRAFATESGESGIGLLPPFFNRGELPVARIGAGYTGLIDEFRITYLPYEPLRDTTDIASRRHPEVRLIGRQPVNREGVVTSPVYDFPSSGTMVNLFEWKENLPAGTHIWFEIRTADEYFEKDEAEPRWYRIENHQRNIYLKQTANGLLRGRYFQWRAHLIGSPEGSQAPVLSDIRMSYELDGPPRPPLLVEVTEAGDEYFIVRWKKNVDHDILGYNIYYGVKSGEYTGIIRYINNGRIVNRPGSSWVQVRVDNAAVDANRERYVRGMLDYPRIKNNILYYVAVTAYDSYRPDTQFNHESAKSKETSARPFAGSEINR
jgi:hypothetical protein